MTEDHKPDDKGTIIATDHLEIVDADTDEVILSVNGKQAKDLRDDND